MSIESRSNQYGSVFGNWQIKKILGQGSGGKSAVFKLSRNDSNWEEECALKVINLIEEKGNLEDISDYRRDEYTSARDECSKNAVQEVRLMATLRGNTNIVDYLDYKFSDWQSDSGFGRDMLIRMELLHDLRSELKNGRIFSEAEIIKIGKDICAALILCHSKDIWHRDIKPENIFINDDGNYKLGDFGISKIMSATPTAMASTGICTPEYAAPEQLSGKHDKRVDIYSLGLVLYELSNKNRLPFASNSYVRQEEVQKRHMGVALPTPCSVSNALTQVILKACAFKPKNRYQTAQEFLDALGALQGKEQPERKRIIGIVLNCNAFSEEGYDIRTAQNIGHYMSLSGNEITYKNTASPTLGDMAFPDSFFDVGKKRLPKRKMKKILADIEALDLPECQSDIDTPDGNGAVKRGIEITYSTGEIYKHTTTGLISPPVLKIAELLGSFCRFRRLPPNWWESQSDIENPTETLVQVDRYQTVPTADPYSTMPAKTQDTRNSEKSKRAIRKGGIIISAIALLLVLVLLIHSCSGNSTTGESTGTQQVDWSKWSFELPDYVTAEDYEIEEQVLYRSRTQETTSSTTQNTMDGWELYHTASSSGDYGSWTSWSTQKVTASETREVETQQQYRYRTKETTTSSAATKSGWEMYNTTYTRGNYGNWSNWSTTAVTASDIRQVETKKQYSYREKETTTSTNGSLSGWTLYDTTYGAWGNAQTTTTKPTESDTLRITATTQTGWGWRHTCYKDAQGVWQVADGTSHTCTTNSMLQLLDYNPGLGVYNHSTYGGQNFGAPACPYNFYYWFRNPGADTYTYTYETRTVTNHFYKWPDKWSAWSDATISSSSDREVKTQTLYRYREREQIPTYHFWRWSAWSDWSADAISETNNRDVESDTYYRYRDKVTETTYYFRKWSDWSEYSETVATPSETIEVETKTQYRFKSKAE